MLHKANKIVCPFSTSDLPKFKVRNEQMEFFPVCVCTAACACATTSGFIWVQVKTAYVMQDSSPGRGCGHAGPSHALKLIDTLFGVAGPDLSEGLVLVSPRSHVLRVEEVIHRFLALVPSVGQLRAQNLGTRSALAPSDPFSALKRETASSLQSTRCNVYVSLTRRCFCRRSFFSASVMRSSSLRSL